LAHGKAEQLEEGDGREDDLTGQRPIARRDKACERAKSDEKRGQCPKEVIGRLKDANATEHTEFLVVSYGENFGSESLFPAIQLNRLDAVEDLVHDPGPGVLDLHQAALKRLLIF